LTGSNPAERETLRYLGSHSVDVIINVIDATHLSQGLSLSLELLELQRPMVVALNMMDEAVQMGLRINGAELEAAFGAPVLPLVASKGRGVKRVFLTALEIAKSKKIPVRPSYSLDVEEVIRSLADDLDGHETPLKAVPMAIKLLEGDESIFNHASTWIPDFSSRIHLAQQRLEQMRGQSSVWVISGERHGLAANLAGKVVEQGERRITMRDRLDNLLLHPLWGYLFLIAILLIFFEVIYGLGSALEAPLLGLFNQLEPRLSGLLGSGTLGSEVLIGIMQGIAGGVAIVLPYLLPFLIGIGFLEDVGYLPRVAFLMDALMHRIGLHGKAVVPFILGYGCNVPAVMSTRMLEDRRDRFLAAALATLVPCAARLAVVFGLVAFYLGPRLALGIYIFNVFVIAVTGRVLSNLMPEETPGLILEIPVYRMPTLRNIYYKVWFRAREFIIEAWPILILGSVVLALLNYFQFAGLFNVFVRPLTWLMGLPEQVGVPLIFGILRKELSLIMLRQALGVTDFSAALTAVQMVTFTVFVVFYIPCLATLAALKRELGWREMTLISLLTVVIALLAALAARVIGLVVLGSS